MSREDILKGRRTMIEKGNFITLANLEEHYIINGNVSPDLVIILYWQNLLEVTKMESEYIRNLCAIIGARSNATVNDQVLEILRNKYNLTDNEWKTMIEYCNEHQISINHMGKETVDDSVQVSEEPDAKQDVTAEERELDRYVETITGRIMHIAAVRAKKRVNGKGWICGTYTKSVANLVKRKVKYNFSINQLRFIVDHLPDESDIEERFSLQDPENVYECIVLNDALNMLIPRLITHRFYSEIFKNET